MLDPLKLRVLRSVVETGSIRASAEALGYTPSAVSQHLSSLHKETGLDLLVRSGRGIEVTSAGRTLASEAGPALDALAGLDRLARTLREGRTGTLTFAYSTSVAATWVPSIARDVRTTFPDLDLELVLRDCIRGFPDGLVPDIVITDGALAQPGGPWTQHPLIEEGYRALVGVDHPLAGRASLPMSALAEEPWVTDDPIDSEWFELIASSARASGFSPNVEVNPPDFASMLGFLASGTYVSVQPALVTQNIRPGVVAIPLEPPAPRRTLSVHVREPISRNPAARFIVEQTRQIARRHAESVEDVIVLP